MNIYYGLAQIRLSAIGGAGFRRRLKAMARQAPLRGADEDRQHACAGVARLSSVVLTKEEAPRLAGGGGAEAAISRFFLAGCERL